MMFHFLKYFLIGLLNFCIVVNAINIWPDIKKRNYFKKKSKKEVERVKKKKHNFN